MYMIEYTCLPDARTHQIICDFDGLFDTVWILNKSQFVYQFKVSQGAMTCNEPKEFGFGNLEKWVNKFEY